MTIAQLLHFIITCFTIKNFLIALGILRAIEWLNKKLFKDVIDLRELVKRIMEKQPLERHDAKEIPEEKHFNAHNVTSLLNRYTVQDIDGYIALAEKLRGKRILRIYSIEDIISRLYEFREALLMPMGIDDSKRDFQIKFQCLLLGQLIKKHGYTHNLIQRYYPTLRGKYYRIKFLFYQTMWRWTKNPKWIL